MTETPPPAHYFLPKYVMFPAFPPDRTPIKVMILNVLGITNQMLISEQKTPLHYGFFPLVYNTTSLHCSRTSGLRAVSQHLVSYGGGNSMCRILEGDEVRCWKFLNSFPLPKDGL